MKKLVARNARSKVWQHCTLGSTVLGTVHSSIVQSQFADSGQLADFCVETR